MRRKDTMRFVFQRDQLADKVKENIINSTVSFPSWEVSGAGIRTACNVTDRLVKRNLTFDSYDLKLL